VEDGAAGHQEPDVSPPRLARALLRVRRSDRLDEIIADLDHLFERRAAARGAAYARRRYWRDVLSLLTPARPERGSSPRDRRERTPPMSAFVFDLRQVARAVRRQPGFFAVASLTLAIGCAAHLSAFTLLDRILLSGPPHVASPADVFRLHVDRADRQGVGRFVWFQTPYRSYADFRSAGGLFAQMAAYRTATASVGTGAEAREVALVYADQHYFPLLGASPQIGRVFGADEDRPPSGAPVVVLGDAYWRAVYGGDPGVVGRDLRIGATTYTIIGVMPRHFTGDLPDRIDAWVPLQAIAPEMPADWTTSLLMRTVSVLVRLAPGVAPAAAAEQAGVGYRRSVDGTPAADPTAQVLLASLNPGRTQRGELTQVGRIAIWLQGVGLLVLLVALANVVNLQMSRAAQMRRDLAVRVALGAGRARLATALLLELLLIAAVATALALALTWVAGTSLQRILLPNTTGGIGAARVLSLAGVTMALGALVCLAFASLQLRVTQVGERLKSGRGGDGFSRERLRQGLLVAQMVVSVLLLVGAGLFLRSMQQLGRLQFGHDHDRVLVATMPLRGAGYSPERIEAFFERTQRELAAVPGVEAVAAAQSTPFAPSQSADIHLPGADRLPLDPRQYPTFYTVSPDFFRTMGMSILRGRAFTPDDRSTAPPVIVLEDALARALFPGAEALGQCVIVGPPTAACRTVVGISSNTRRFVTLADGALRYYVPIAQRVQAYPPQAIFVRTAGDPVAAMPSVRAGLLAIDPGLPFIRLRTLNEMAEPEKRPWRLGSTLFVVFGAAALLVATTGVYALLSFIVAQRSREIGVRLALGASPAQTLRLVIRQSVGWVCAGLVVGSGVALGAGRFVRPMLFETSPYDPSVFAGAAALLLAVGIMAAFVPALRASRVDPNVALRAE
jgi:predicted permease